MSKDLSLLEAVNELMDIYEQLYIIAIISGNQYQVIRMRLHIARLDKLKLAINN